MRRVSLLLLLILCCTFLCGCLGATGPGDFGYVIIIGVDEGKTRQYNVTMMLQSNEEGGDSQAGKGGSSILTAEGDSLFQAIGVLRAAVPYELQLSRAGLIVFSDEVAKANKIQPVLDMSWSSLKLRQSIRMMVVLGKAEEFIRGLDTADNPNIAKLLTSLMQTYSSEGITAVTNYALFEQGIKSGCYDPVLTLGRLDKSDDKQKEQQSGATGQQGGSGQSQGGGQQGSGVQSNSQQGSGQAEYVTMGSERTGAMPAYVAGAALFSGGCMAGVLNEQETMLLLMVKGDFKSGNIKVPTSKGVLLLELKAGRSPHKKIELVETPRGSATVYLHCELQQVEQGSRQSGRNWETDLRGEVQKYMETELLRLFDYCRQLDADAMGFGEAAVKSFTNAEAWREYDWKADYREMEAEFSVEMELIDENMVEYRE